MSLTIVIVNWNGGDLLLRCLQTIRASHASFPVHVIVVDNDSHDGSRERAQREFPQFHIFNSGANLGFGKANNLARPLVKTSLVLFLNPDTELRPDTLERVVQCLRDDPDVGALGCKMLDTDGSVQQQGFQWHLTPWKAFVELVLVSEKIEKLFKRWLPTHHPCQSGYVRKLYGGFMLARKDVLDRAGWFDERYFMYAEDADLSRTIESLGWRLYYTADAEIIHVAGGTSAKAPSGFSVLMKAESITQLMDKYYGRANALIYRFGVFLAATLRLVVLCIPRVFCKAFPFRGSNALASAFFRSRLLAAWALGLRKASPPGGAPSGGALLDS